jgi:hypothetical protein
MLLKIQEAKQAWKARPELFHALVKSVLIGACEKCVSLRSPRDAMRPTI